MAELDSLKALLDQGAVVAASTFQQGRYWAKRKEDVTHVFVRISDVLWTLTFEEYRRLSDAQKEAIRVAPSGELHTP